MEPRSMGMASDASSSLIDRGQEPAQSCERSDHQQTIVGPQVDSNVPSNYLPGFLLTAVVVLFIGTGLIDPSRLRLFIVPVTFLLTAYGVGAIISLTTNWFPSFPHATPMLDLGLKLGVGVACMTMVIVVSVLAGGFFYGSFLLLPATLFGLWQVLRGLPSLSMANQSLAPWFSGLLVGMAWLVAWLWGTIPPTFYDELAYHLVIPQRVLASGMMEVTPWVFFTLMPHASDLMLAWGMWFDEILGTRALGFALWVICCLAACGIAERIAVPSQQALVPWVLVCLLSTSPTLWFLATLPFAETCLTLAILTALAVLLFPGSGQRPWVLLGMALGLAGSVKLAGLFWVAAGFGAALVAKWPLRDMIRSGFLVLACLLPWWVRGIVHTGNPIYPMGYSWLGGTYWSHESQARVAGDLPPGILGFSGMDLLRLPWDLFQHPERFGSASDAGMISILCVCLLVLLPLIAVVGKFPEDQRRWIFPVTTFVCIAGMGWLLTSTTTRFLAPVLFVSLTVVAGLLLRLPSPILKVGLLILLLSGVWGTEKFLSQHSQVFSSVNVALGRESADHYLDRRLAHVPAARFVRTQLHEDAKLLFIGETRPYYFSRPSLAPSAFDRHPLKQWVEEAKSVEDLLATIVGQGFTHIVLNIQEFERVHQKYGVLRFTGDHADEQARRLRTLPSLLHTLYSEKGVVVLEVPPKIETSLSEL